MANTINCDRSIMPIRPCCICYQLKHGFYWCINAILVRENYFWVGESHGIFRKPVETLGIVVSSNQKGKLQLYAITYPHCDNGSLLTKKTDMSRFIYYTIIVWYFVFTFILFCSGAVIVYGVGPVTVRSWVWFLNLLTKNTIAFYNKISRAWTTCH